MAAVGNQIKYKSRQNNDLRTLRSLGESAGKLCIMTTDQKVVGSNPSRRAISLFCTRSTWSGTSAGSWLIEIGDVFEFESVPGVPQCGWEMRDEPPPDRADVFVKLQLWLVPTSGAQTPPVYRQFH
jgi:hypothetical protein